jgi:hypothetical protein
MVVQFYQLAPGAQFVFHGKRYRKIAMSMARDSRGWGCVFMGGTEVEPEGELLLLPEAEAARWKPDLGHWAAAVAGTPTQEDDHSAADTDRGG